MIEKVYRGQTTRRYAYYKNGMGTLVEPINPSMTIIDPINVVILTNATPIKESLGVYYYDFQIPVDAKYGIYTEKWKGTLDLLLVESIGYFEVYSVGAIEQISSAMREELRLRISDQDATMYTFSDEELNKVLESCRLKHNAFYKGWSEVPNNETTLILILAHADICLILATTNAKYYAVTGNINIDKGARTEYYLEIRRSLKAEYYKECRKLGLTNEQDVNKDAMPEIQVSGITIMDRETGRMVQRDYDMPPPPVTITYTQLNGINIFWNRSKILDFQKYEILKDNNIIWIEYDINKLSYNDKNVVPTGSYTYFVRTVDDNGLSADSNKMGVIVN